MGAGASKDYIRPQLNRKSADWKPPLTNDMFGRNVFDQYLDKYPEVKHLAADALTKVPERMSLEDYLSDIKENKAATDANRQKQLVALGFYLQQLFQKISSEYGNQHLNNYVSLITKIKDNGGKALIINFNYDKLLEQNIPGIKDRISQYLEGAIKVIKIHGACDWTYSLQNMFNENRDPYDFFMQNPWFETKSENTQPKLTEEFRGLGFESYKQNYQGQYWNFYPAVAIPITKDKFICPEKHITHLKSELAATDRILIIGWSAGDPQLLGLLEENIKKTTSVLIVSRNFDSASAIGKKMESNKLLKITPSGYEGFSNFMRSEEIDKFLES